VREYLRCREYMSLLDPSLQRSVLRDFGIHGLCISDRVLYRCSPHLGSRVPRRGVGKPCGRWPSGYTHKDVAMIKNSFLLAAAANAYTLDDFNRSLAIWGERLGRVS
jgi:hypothetical protein